MFNSLPTSMCLTAPRELNFIEEGLKIMTNIVLICELVSKISNFTVAIQIHTNCFDGNFKFISWENPSVIFRENVISDKLYDRHVLIYFLNIFFFMFNINSLACIVKIL